MNKKNFRNMLFIFLIPFFLLGCTSNAHQKENPSGENEGQSHHTETVQFELVQPIELNNLEMETEFQVIIFESDHPLANANVSFEYWCEGEIEHQSTDATESEAGQYSATLSFLKPGDYIIKVHLEKGDIHDHKEWMVKVVS